MTHWLVVLGRGGFAGAAAFGIATALAGRASPLVMGCVWIAGIALDRAVQQVASRLGER